MTQQLLICTTCGNVGVPVTAKRGTVLISIILWLTFIVPGIIYSLWRLATQYRKCSVCGSTSLVPLNTPVGQKLLSDQGKTTEQVAEEIPTQQQSTVVSHRVVLVVVIISVLVFLIFPLLFSN